MGYKALQFTLIIAAIFSFTTARKVLAETDHMYAGLDVVATHFSGDGPKDRIIYQKGQHFSDQDTKYGVRFGYQISDWLATEVAYTDFGRGTDIFGISPNIYFFGAPMDTQTVGARGASLVAAFKHSFTTRGPSAPASVFAILGVASIDYDVTWSGGFSELTGSPLVQRGYSYQGLTFGVGAKYALNDEVNLRADVRRYDVGDFQLDSLSAGLEFNF